MCTFILSLSCCHASIQFLSCVRLFPVFWIETIYFTTFYVVILLFNFTFRFFHWVPISAMSYLIYNSYCISGWFFLKSFIFNFNVFNHLYILGNINSVRVLRFHGLQNFTFSGMPYTWTHEISSLFRLASFT